MDRAAEPIDVFVAYSSHDEQRVRTIVDWLRGNGLRVWVAYELPAGLDWDTEIDRVLAAIPCVLVVWSNSAAASAEVKGEARLGMARDALVTVSLDRALPPRSFTHLHAVDLSGLSVDEDSPRTAQVLSGIRAKLGARDQRSDARAQPSADDVPPPSNATSSARRPAHDRRRARGTAWLGGVAGLVIGAGTLAWFVSGADDAHASCDDSHAYRLAGQTFSRDTVIEQALVCVADNATIRVENGAALTIEAETLVLQGAATFEGRGRDGRPGQRGSDGPVSTREPPGGLLAICARKPPRADYDGKPGTRGGNGGPGANIVLRYVRLIGDDGLLTHDVSGGNGGAGGRGGRGGRAVCKAAGAYNVKGRNGASGAAGTRGADGSFALVRAPR